jgi:hypothetical protein
VAAYLVPPETLLALPIGLRFGAATVVAFAPVFVANLVFAQRFQAVSASAVAFGANLLGAMAGGVLEYLAIVVGYRNLLILAGLLYLGAFLIERRWRAAYS